MFKTTFFISAPITYSSTSISILRGLEPVILTVQWYLSLTGVSGMDFLLGIMCFKIR